MKDRRLIKKSLPGIMLVLGFVGGYSFFIGEGGMDRTEYGTTPAKSGLRRSAGWERKEHELMKKEFTVKDLKSLKGWLARNPSSEQVKEKLADLMQYSFRKSDENLYLAMQHLFSYWGRKDPQKAFEEVMKLSGTWVAIKKDLVQTALASSIRNAPSEVAGWFADESTGLCIYPEILPSLAQSLTERSPDQAWEWLSSLKYLEQSRALSSFFEVLYHSQPERMGEFIKLLDSPKNWSLYISGDLFAGGKVRKIVRLYAKADYEEATRWVDTFPENAKEIAYEQLLAGKAEKDPAEATRLLLDIQEGKSFALREIASAVIGSNDYEKIESWFQELAKTDSGIQPANYSFIGDINPIDAAKILNNLPEGAVKDALIYNYVYGDLNPDHKEVEKLLQQIRDKDLREISKECLEKNKMRKKDKFL